MVVSDLDALLKYCEILDNAPNQVPSWGALSKRDKHYKFEYMIQCSLNQNLVLTVSFAISKIKHFAIFVQNSFLEYVFRKKVLCENKVTISKTLFYSFSKHLRTRMLFLKMKPRKPHFIIVGSFFSEKFNLGRTQQAGFVSLSHSS